MILYRFPYTYEEGAVAYRSDTQWMQGDPAPEIIDGRIDTSNASSRYLIDFAGTDQKSINAIFVETSGFDNISIQADAGAGNSVNFGPVSINDATHRRGSRHYANATIPLVDLQASRVRITFGGAPGRVYRIALTQLLLNIPIEGDIARTAMSHQRVGEGNTRRPNVNGNIRVIPGRAGRWKWRTDISLYLGANSNPTADQLIDTLDANNDFFVWPLPTDDPTRFYPASLDPPNFDINYVGDLLTQREIGFTMREL